MRVVSLNIRHGGGHRISPLTDWLAARDASAIVVTEWRNNLPGACMIDRLGQNGFEWISPSKTNPQSNTVLLAAKGIKTSQLITPPASPMGDLMLADLTGNIRILGCYFPQSMAKVRFFEKCVEEALRHPDIPFLLIGDMNTGHNKLDLEGSGAPFHCADLFRELGSRGGLIDLWRARHGQRQDWTWRSSKNGFRIDHAFGNQVLINRYPNFRCEIEHGPRLLKLTDHSALVLDLD
jgi:exodeoxyribonuclease-3